MAMLKTLKDKAEKVFSPRKSNSRSSEDTGGDMTIGAPVFQGHHTHVTVDKDGNIEGLPEEMKNMLKVNFISCFILDVGKIIT